MRPYFIFLSKPIEFELDKDNNTVKIILDKKIIAHSNIDKLKTELQGLLKHLDKITNGYTNN